MAGYLCPMPIGILFANGILSLLGHNIKREGTSAMEALSLYAVFFMQ